MDAIGVRNSVKQILGADDALAVTTVHAQVGETGLVVQLGDRGPLEGDDRFEVTIWRDGDSVEDPLSIGEGPNEHDAIAAAWSKAKSRLR